ncbi:hypothetical protein ACTMU2_24605 [Cupriavidus basilensis]
MLEMFEQARIRGLALNPAQALAALFHDAVYVPGCEHNEAASAALIGTMAPGVDAATVQRAAQIVLDTRTHEATVAEAGTVLDLDLYRLAVAPADFDTHSLEVFAENRALLAASTGLSGEAADAGFPGAPRCVPGHACAASSIVRDGCLCRLRGTGACQHCARCRRLST